MGHLFDQEGLSELHARLEAAEARAAQLHAELSAAVGSMTAAVIELQTGAPKEATLATLNGGLSRACAALDVRCIEPPPPSEGGVSDYDFTHEPDGMTPGDKGHG